MSGFILTYGPSLGFAATTVAARVAGGFAYFAVRTQRDLARKRATLDFFLKTKTDANMLSLWREYEGGLKVLDAFGPEKLKSASLQSYVDVRNYLNIFELFACSYYGNILDKPFCRTYFRPTVLEAYGKTSGLIKVINQEYGSEQAYCDFVRLAKSWR